LDVAKFVGSLKTYLVLGHKHETVKEYLGKDYVTVVQKKLLGTADAVKYVQRYFKSYSGDVLILCGDTPLLNKDVIKRLVKKHRKEQSHGQKT